MSDRHVGIHASQDNWVLVIIIITIFFILSIISGLSQRMMMLVFVSLRFGLRLVAWEP